MLASLNGIQTTHLHVLIYRPGLSCIPITANYSHYFAYFYFQNLYGRLGRKPDKTMIRVYERYSLGNKIFKYLNLCQMLKVTVTR